MLRDFGGGWPLTRPLDHRRIPTSRRRRCGRGLVPLGTNARRHYSSESVNGEPISAPRSAFAYGSPSMSVDHPKQFEDHRWVGDKRNQVVHDLDVCTGQEIIDELMQAEQYLWFG